jgi:hypothetical protein
MKNTSSKNGGRVLLETVSKFVGTMPAGWTDLPIAIAIIGMFHHLIAAMRTEVEGCPGTIFVFGSGQINNPSNQKDEYCCNVIRRIHFFLSLFLNQPSASLPGAVGGCSSTKQQSIEGP